MPNRTKPGVDWAGIERRYRAGEGSTSIAKDYDIKRQSIDKRARIEGWRDSGPEKWLPAARNTDTARRLLNPQTTRDKQLATRGNRTPENLALILDKIEQGSPIYVAVGTAGITDETFREWKKDDPTVNPLVQQARQDFISRQYGNIAAAGDRGDWKASQALLQSAPETRKDWANGSSGGSGITVNISISGEDTPPVVDITPDTKAK